MSYVPGFSIDVFISYSHLNNAAGWVSELNRYLSQRVPQFLEHGADIVIWRDEKLNGFDLLWDTLKEKVRNSALFLSILSPVYVTSDSCEAEVNFFLDEALPTRQADRRARMARAVIIPYKGTVGVKSCFERLDTVNYTFFTTGSNEIISQYQTDSPEFIQEAERLTQHIAHRLRRLRGEQVKEIAASAPKVGKKIFIANCSKDRASDRMTVINEFRGHELRSIPVGAYSREELSHQVEQLLDAADYSIHILGENPGITLDSGDGPIAYLEYRLALCHRPPHFKQIVWIPDTLNLQPGLHKEFVDKIRAFNPELWNEGAEVLGGGVDGLLRAVHSILDGQDDTALSKIPGPIYLVCAKADLDNEDANLKKLSEYLCGKGIQPEFPAFEDQDVDLAEVERNVIAQSSATLIYYGRGGDGWVKLKRQTVLRVLGELKEAGSYVRALYLSEPLNTPKRVQYLSMQIREFQEARNYPALLILGAACQFDPVHLKPFLERL